MLSKRTIIVTNYNYSNLKIKLNINYLLWNFGANYCRYRRVLHSEIPGLGDGQSRDFGIKNGQDHGILDHWILSLIKML